MDEHLLNFDLSDGKLTMSIKMEDLVKLFDEDPKNFEPVHGIPLCVVNKGSIYKFAEALVEILKDDCPTDPDNYNWSRMFDEAFMQMRESGADYLDYLGDPNLDEEDDE